MQDLSIEKYGCGVRVEWTTARFGRLAANARQKPAEFDRGLTVRDVLSIGPL